MTSPRVPAFASDMAGHYRRLTIRAARRDKTARMIQEVRRGNLRQLFPDDFPSSFGGVPTANFIDNVAKDLAESIAPLPSLKCSSGRMTTAADKARAEIKNRIGDNYWSHSKLKTQMTRGANRYTAYGFVPFYVEPDIKNQMPYIHVEPSHKAYYELDRYENCKVYARTFDKTIDELCACWPELKTFIKKDQNGIECPGDSRLEMVRWVDDTKVTLFLPERGGLVLESYEHKMSRCPVRIAELPSDEEPGTTRGQFDDVVFVQVARAMMGVFALEAAHKAVQAPTALPSDVDELPIGPDAVIVTDNPQGVRRVGLDISPTAFAESQVLDNELKAGSRYPDARTGGVQASVITGKGVEALLGTFDTQIKSAQNVFEEVLQDVTSMCFEMDEAWWPNVSKVLTGTVAGTSYEYSYTPAKDISGRYAATVTYGFAAGMHPSQSIITMLQLNQAGLIADETTQANLPFSIDPSQEKRKIDIEGWREAIKQGMFSVIQSAGPLAVQGQDPLPLLKLAIDAVKAVQNGRTIEDAAYEAFQAMEEAKQQAQQEALEAQMGQEPGMEGGGGAGGMSPDGLPPNVAPGQAGLPPGGLPTIQSMIAGFRGNGNIPVMQSTVQRRTATGQ